MWPFLELVRIYLTPTAIADSLAGYFFASSLTGSESPLEASPGRLALVAAVSVLVYWTGMVTNDLFDIRKDRARHPTRPLPRGAVRVSEAIALAAALTLLPLYLSYRLRVLPVFLILITAVLAYNGGGKKIPIFGNLLMGACRSLNFLLGISLATTPGRLPVEVSVLLAAAVPGAYIALVTSISLLEDRPYRPASITRILSVLLAVPVGLGAWGWRYPGAWMNAIFLIGLLGREFRLPRPESFSERDPHPAERVVRSGLSGIYFVDAGLLWCRDLAGPALGMYGLFVLGWLWKRWWLKSSKIPNPKLGNGRKNKNNHPEHGQEE